MTWLAIGTPKHLSFSNRVDPASAHYFRQSRPVPTREQRSQNCISKDMRTALRVSCCLPVFLSLLSAQVHEPIVSKDSLSVHTVERGDMPVRERAMGTIVSVRPPKAILTLSDQGAQMCKIGQTGSAQLKPPTVMAGKIVSVDHKKCEIEFSNSLPVTVRIGDKLHALVETGVMRGVTFFERPANSSANSDGFV
jgi:hypothetical protein